MLTKILLTALIIVGCYTYLRYKRNLEQGDISSQRLKGDDNTPTPAIPSTVVRWLATGLVFLSVAGAVGFFIYDWNDSRTLLEVKVINPQSGEQIRYQVYKGDMEERSFKTIQGQQVRIANTERLEVMESR
ncbi:hypothetical protein [Motiliproteus sp. MSK22-1]|uniref:hypothetical protein n=1 Tax=Motiliproteus sp. MSK22-1 TaxID=1897630 RepID=UPI000975F1C3|nr:hypothetical protein [Motiliproteus sp. MSK22-1]OMH38058.1 hypothetical protein BGP75_07180 [Motiliproteus sp. MSK22-1]